MNKRILTWIGVIIIVVLIIVGVRSKSSTPSQTIKIGVVAPMTGGAATYGVGLVKGIEMAKADLKGTKNNYEFIVEDDGTNPANAASAAQKLVNIDKVQALVTVTSGTGNAVKPIAAANKIPHVCVCADARLSDNSINFINSVVPDDEMKVWVAYAAEQGVKKIAIIAQNHPGFNLITDTLKKQLASSGIEVVYEEHFEPTQKDFKTDIAKAGQKKPDLYFIGAYPPPVDILGQELKGLGVTNIAGVGTFAISATPEVFNDRWYSDATLTDQAFKDRFVKEYPELRFNVRVVPYGYDTFNMLVAANESGDIAKYLLDSTGYSGKSGNLTKTKGDGIFHAPASIWTIKNGQAVTIK